jgi:hypothetical protein
VTDDRMTREEMLAEFHRMDTAELRGVIAYAAGIAAAADRDGGVRTALALSRIADRLTGKPRKVAA